MNRHQLVQRVRSLTRDFSNAVFREIDIINFINEGIERFQQAIPEFEGELSLEANESTPMYIPKRYHHLLALYSASRCFSQDERHYQSTTLMNEFEVKLEELKAKIESGEVAIVDPATGLPIETTYEPDYVTDAYFNQIRITDLDKGVDG